ncbi:winged helix-turn-helix domain-containing protein [Streptomyces cheonanensis]|uniref:Winged helix-turn-helix domain-containing protein n=1 Tax=Streptomyces cheonanensis TaxID=312720 RepID=A0ABP5H2M5_9ACTN
MALRVRFSESDTGRVRVAERSDELWEILLAAHQLQRQDGAEVFAQWRRFAASRLTGPMRRLLVLAPARGYSPDFLTPAEARSGGFDAGLNAVRETGRARLSAELAQLPPARRDFPWVRALARGEAADMRRLGEGIAAFRRALLAPFMPVMERQLAADRAWRAQVLLRGGVDLLLSTLHPTVTWEPPVLRVAQGPFGRELRLDGRGLVLVPAFFCWRVPTVLRDPALPPVLVYPIRHETAWATPPPDVGQLRRVSRLLGRTRAAVLEAAASGGSTTELAGHIRASPASASEHLRVLREAGLVLTRREGATSQHSLSPLGRALLEGTPDSRL